MHAMACRFAHKTSGSGLEGGTHERNYLVWRIDERVPVEAEDAPPGGHEAVVAGPIGGTVEEARVVEVAVGLDEHLGLAVHELDPADPTVGVADVDLTGREREPCVGQDLEQPRLELT